MRTTDATASLDGGAPQRAGSLLDRLRDAILAADGEHRVVFANAAAEALFASTSLIGRNLAELLVGEIACQNAAGGQRSTRAAADPPSLWLPASRPAATVGSRC